MVFAKAPVPGRVKTRLKLDPDDAAALHSAFVRDVVERHANEKRRMVVYRAGDLDHPFWPTLDLTLAECCASSDLGERMQRAFEAEFAKSDNPDDARIVVIGSDSPTLPPSIVDEAFRRLDKGCRVVIGPACDGGYYLLGMRGGRSESGLPKRIFQSGMPWGTCDVLAMTLERLAADEKKDEPAIVYELLEFWYDVDRPEDLRMVRAHANALSAKGVPLPRRTLELLAGRGTAWGAR